DGPGITRAIVNNGGDIAFWLAPGTTMTALMAADPPARITLGPDQGIGGIATSGWRGRSASLGIADSVTVLATTAAMADAAATLIANAVDLANHPAIRRAPARDLAPDSDLGARPVTVDVGALTGSDIEAALSAGRKTARDMQDRGLIRGASLTLQGRLETVGSLALPPAETPMASLERIRG
ncbi:MAG: UPF0280 family protein, partial [Marinibacterium sp.]